MSKDFFLLIFMLCILVNNKDLFDSISFDDTHKNINQQMHNLTAFGGL